MGSVSQADSLATELKCWQGAAGAAGAESDGKVLSLVQEVLAQDLSSFFTLRQTRPVLLAQVLLHPSTARPSVT